MAGKAWVTDKWMQWHARGKVSWKIKGCWKLNDWQALWMCEWLMRRQWVARHHCYESSPQKCLCTCLNMHVCMSKEISPGLCSTSTDLFGSCVYDFHTWKLDLLCVNCLLSMRVARSLQEQTSFCNPQQNEVPGTRDTSDFEFKVYPCTVLFLFDVAL